METSSAEPGSQYYEQLRYNNTWFKVGDCVYIQSHGLSKPRVARCVDRWVGGTLVPWACGCKCGSLGLSAG